MTPKRFIILFLIFINASAITICTAQSENNLDSIQQTEHLKFIVEKSAINKSSWLQPYRFQDKNLKTLAVKIIIKRISDKNNSVDFNLFTLVDESKKLRTRPSGVYYPKGDKKKYLKSKPINKNYNSFKETTIEGFQNFEAETYKINFLGLKKKKEKPSIKSLKKLTIKSKNSSYFIDFPVQEGFTYGKIYYKGKPIGFAAVKN